MIDSDFSQHLSEQLPSCAQALGAPEGAQEMASSAAEMSRTLGSKTPLSIITPNHTLSTTNTLRLAFRGTGQENPNNRLHLWPCSGCQQGNAADELDDQHKAAGS